MNVINHAVEFLLAFMEISLCYRIVSNVLFNKDDLKRKEKVFLSIVTIILSALLYLNRRVVFISYSMFIIITVITIISFYILKKQGILNITGIVIAYYLFIMLAELFLAFMSMLFLKQDFYSLIYAYATSFWKNYIYLSAGMVFLCIIIYMEKKKILENINITAYGKLLLLFDIVFFFVFYQYLRILEEMSVGEQEMQGIAAGMTLLVVVGIFAFILVLLMKYQNIQEENRHYLIRDEIYKQNSDEINNLLQMNRETVHNIKNHLLIMKKMGSDNDIERLTKYIDTLCQEIRDTDEKKWTGHRVLDMIISQKKIIAEQRFIRFHVQTMLLPEIKMTDVEICALFGNILDNSIESCDKIDNTDKFIEMKIEMREGLLLVRLENSMQERPIIKKGELISLKEDKNIHGLGMKSVKRIVEKYDGAITYRTREHSFVLVLTFFDMLKERRSERRADRMHRHTNIL